MTDAEREYLRRHEEWISQPVSVLFPPTGPQATSVCRWCKTVYTRSAHTGKARGFCTDTCRNSYSRSSRYPPRAPQFRSPR